MKKNDLILTAAVALYSFLFYGYYGNSLSVTADVLSLSLLSGISFTTKSSVLLSIIFSFYSYCSAPAFMIVDWVEKKKEETTATSSPVFKKAVLIGVPLLITLLFFFMYRASNPLFNNFSQKINFDFISVNWMFFTLGGLVIMYGFFYHRRIMLLSGLDDNATMNLIPQNKNTSTILGKKLSIDDEIFSGVVLFLLLNGLLLIVNLLDFNFMFISGTLPVGVTYSEFVHQGTGMLITSILFAVAIILFYFRGDLNFYKKSKTIKYLAYLWIVQNAAMLISTALRNGMYIHEYGLTYKRIGVYIYLLLTLIGLTNTFVKILQHKTNNYLFRINGWLFYTILILSCCFNWDVIITNFNINDAKRLEKNHLLSLSDSNLPQLFLIQQDTTTVHKEFTLTEKDNFEEDENSSYRNYQFRSFDERLSFKLYWFLQQRNSLTWKSWYYENTRIHNDLINLNKKGFITRLCFSKMYMESLSSIKEMNNIKELYLNSNHILNIKELSFFPMLIKLDLSDNKLNYISGIESLTHLEYLNLSRNNISDYSPLYKMKQLKEIRLGYPTTPTEVELLRTNLPSTLIITD